MLETDRQIPHHRKNKTEKFRFSANYFGCITELDEGTARGKKKKRSSIPADQVQEA